MNAIITIESTEQINLDPAMFGTDSEVVVEAVWSSGARIHVPASEVAFVEAALEADERVTQYTTTVPGIPNGAVRVGGGW